MNAAAVAKPGSGNLSTRPDTGSTNQKKKFLVGLSNMNPSQFKAFLKNSQLNTTMQNVEKNTDMKFWERDFEA